VVVFPSKEEVLSWPENPDVKQLLLGEPSFSSKPAMIVYETIYSTAPDRYWHNRRVFIIEQNGSYFLVTEEGVKACLP
jgi:hypothetical protein